MDRFNHLYFPFCPLIGAKFGSIQKLLGTNHVLAQPFLDIFDAVQKQAITQYLSNLELLTSPISFECAIRAFDDTVKHFLWTIYPHSGQRLNIVGRDITAFHEMEAKEKERNIFAEALLDTMLAINASLSLEQVLERILSNIGKVVEYDYVNIMLVDEKAAEVVSTLRKDPYQISVNLQHAKAYDIRQHTHLLAIYTSQECAIVSQMSRPPAWMMSHVTNTKSGSFLGAPITVGNQVIGFLSVFYSHEGFFTPLHAQQLTTFASQIGIAIVNARLYEQSQSAATLRERQRVAQDLHDSVKQELFAANTYADLLIKAIERRPQAVSQYASDISRLVRRAVQQMQMILIELHPDTLVTTPIGTLIKQLGTNFESRMGIPVHIQADTDYLLSTEDQIAVYRIVQEALHNIEKHANAQQVNISIQQSTDSLGITIEDNGIGFDPELIEEIHFGISGMYERAVSIDANLRVSSVPNLGTVIRLTKEFDDVQ
jgi:signal transduction histidine kinase